jgi:hypothetical protein
MMRTAVLLAILIASPAAALAQEPGKCVVKDGKTSGVCYGMSLVADLWGNFRRGVWTFRPDGTMLFSAPEGGFEEFLKRELTAGEKANASTYSIDGEKLLFSYRDGSQSEGKVEYADDKSIKRIQAGGLFLYPIAPGLGTKLTGSWNNTFAFTSGALNMRTTVLKNFSFFESGAFVHESATATVAGAVQSRSGSVDSVRDEAIKFYGSEAPSKMGKFEAKASALTLTYENGTKEQLFVGRIGEVKGGEPSLILIGSGLYEGTFGVFPKSSGSAAPAATVPAAGLGRCTAAQFDLAVTTGWHARKEDLDGLQAFLITPAGAAPDEVENKFTLVLTGTELEDRTTKATDAAMIASLEKLVTAWCKNDAAAKAGAAETTKIGGVAATRMQYTLTRDGAPVSIEAACAVRDGNALVALTIASEAAMKKHGAAARELLAKTIVAGEVKSAKGNGFELQIPKPWSSRETEQNGVKTLLIVPPAGENEYVIQLIPTDTEHAAATDAGAVQELRDLIKQFAPAMEPMGNVETLKAPGGLVSTVVYGGQNEKQETILVKAYLALKGKRAVVMLVVGKETRDKEYRTFVRKAVETLTLK